MKDRASFITGYTLGAMSSLHPFFNYFTDKQKSIITSAVAKQAKIEWEIWKANVHS